MKPGEDAVLVCLRVSEHSIALVVPGSVQDNCCECDHRVWIAKAGQNLIATHTGTVRVMCIECAETAMKNDPPERMEIAPGAIEEAARHLGGF